MNRTEKAAFRESVIVVMMGMVINFRFQTSTIAPGASEVIAYGTAVTFGD